MTILQPNKAEILKPRNLTSIAAYITTLSRNRCNHHQLYICHYTLCTLSCNSYTYTHHASKRQKGIIIAATTRRKNPSPKIARPSASHTHIPRVMLNLLNRFFFTIQAAFGFYIVSRRAETLLLVCVGQTHGSFFFLHFASVKFSVFSAFILESGPMRKIGITVT